MRNKTNIQRMGYAAAFMLILVIEAGIALFVRDSFIRPYGGDVLGDPALLFHTDFYSGANSAPAAVGFSFRSSGRSGTIL